MFRMVAVIVAVGILLGSFCPSTTGQKKEATGKLPRFGPRTPAEALRTFQIRDGFRLELLAHEPLVSSPVVLEYDENGRAWVVEMGDYPYTDKNKDKPFAERPADDLPLGRIRILEDTDGDGRFDKSTIFADNLSWPTGLAFWKGGVFVTATPDIWYLRDTDGDGKADVRVKMFTGFRKFNIQAVINNLKWGLDHHIHGAGGTNGGLIQNLKDNRAAPVKMATNDFRIDPVTHRFELLAGGARFGHTFDDWGNRFLCNIRNPAIHVVLPNHYLARNPFLPVPRAVHDVAEAGDSLPVFRISPSEPWRALRAERWVTEAGQTYPRSELVADGYFTSACGITIYRGDAYPAKFHGNIFLAEVSANLIHRQILTPKGVTFTARRAEEKAEFVASTDTWFRPVNFVNAPDGTLHVVDMYRETIEHPWSIPDDIHEQLNLLSGRERGRIYRLAPPNFQPPPRQRLGAASTAELVACLEKPNAWHRETAHRLLYERQDRQAVKPLERLLRNSTSPLARLHALWSLHGLKELTYDDILIGLADPAPGVREHAVRLSEPRLPDMPLLVGKVLALAKDPDPRVRFQVAFTLGGISDDRATTALADIACRDGQDPWLRTAVLSSAAERADRLLLAILQREELGFGQHILHPLAQVIGARRKGPELARVFAALGHLPDTTAAWTGKTAIIHGLGKGLKAGGKNLLTMVRTLHPSAEQTIVKLLAKAQKHAQDERAPAGQREQAMLLLGLADFAAVKDTLQAGLDARQPQMVQLAALRTLAEFADPQVASLLLAGYPSFTPPLRAETIEALLARPIRVPHLLAALERRHIPLGDVPPARKGLLMRHRDPTISNRALALFKASLPSPRGEVLAKYAHVPRLSGDAKRGQLVFDKECASCHKFRNQGQEVGPNLETVLHHTPAQVLTNILDPNREVAPNYLEYLVTLTDGKVTTGRISTETATSLTLQRANNVQETILRQNIDHIAATNRSLMPEGLEQRITPPEMADLLAFLFQGRKGKP